MATVAQRRWRRTSFRRPDGDMEFAPNSWTLVDRDWQPLARVYRYQCGPLAGRWSWIVLGDAEGRSYLGRSGNAETAREAREACEALIPGGAILGRRTG